MAPTSGTLCWSWTAPHCGARWRFYQLEGDWRAHKHHQDAAYDSVVLHVVGSTPRSDRQAPRLPTVVLGTVPSPAHSSKTQNPTQSLLLSSLASVSEAELSSLLQGAGLARYAKRVAQAMAGIRGQGVEQTLFAGLLDALGYSENRAAFETLGRCFPSP